MVDKPCCSECGAAYETEREKAAREFALTLEIRDLAEEMLLRDPTISPLVARERANNISAAIGGNYELRRRA